MLSVLRTGGSASRFGPANAMQAQGGMKSAGQEGATVRRTAVKGLCGLRELNDAKPAYTRAQRATRSWFGKRTYSVTVEEDEMPRSETAKYTDEDLLSGTIDINGFRILGDGESEVDIGKWEQITRTAFNQMRFADCISAYDKIKGLGPNAAEMSEIHIRALDALGTRQEDIINTYRDMRQRGVRILSHSYAKVMKAMYKSGEKSRIITLFELMQSEGTPGTPELYAVLLTLYYNEKPDDIESALGILATMKSNSVAPSVDVIARAFLFFVEAQRYDLITQTYTEHVVNGSVKPDRIILSIMAEAMLHNGNLGKARDFLKQLDKLRRYPRLTTYEMWCDVALKKRKKEHADDVLAEMVHNAKYPATLAVYKSFFRYFEKGGDYDGLQRMLEKMVREQVAPDAEILECMMTVYFAHRKDEEYLATFVQMLDRQMMPKREFWTMRMKVFAENGAGGMAGAEEEGEHLANFTLMLREYEYMLQAGITPTEEELRLVMNSLQEAGMPDTAEAFAQTELARFGIQLDATDYALLMRNYGRYSSSQQSQQEVMRVYHRFVTSGISDAEPHLLIIQSMLSWAANPSLLAPSADLVQNPLDQCVHILETELIPSLLNSKYIIDATQACRLIENFTYLGQHGYELVMKIFNLLIKLDLLRPKQLKAQAEAAEAAEAAASASKEGVGAKTKKLSTKPRSDRNPKAASSGLVCTEVFDILIRYLSSMPSHLESAVAHFKMMQEDPRFKLGPTIAIYHTLMQQFALATERESSTRHITTVIELFVTYLHDPAMLPLKQNVVSTFLLFLIRHGSQHGFSHAVNWYKTLGGNDSATITQFQTAALRKWAAQELKNNAAAFVPSSFITRDLNLLQGAILPSSQEVELRISNITL